MSTLKLVWDKKYSVGVEEIDGQHKRMFEIINELLDAINTNTAQEKLGHIIDSLIKYKIFHFATEEKYFKEFNYGGIDEHVTKHHEFNTELEALKNKYPVYTMEFSFELVDFLENWLIDHLMVMDQKYKKCFAEHGLK